MFDRSSGKKPVAAFEIPPHAPKAVFDAFAKFNSLGDRWGELDGEIHDARAEIRRAQARDIEEAAASYVAGKEPRSVNVNEEKARAELAALEAKRAPLSVALDEAGNELAQAIVDSRDQWTVTLTDAEESARQDLISALAATRDAIAALAPARAATGWLERFDLGQAIVGREQQFFGGQIFLDTTSVRRESREPVASVLSVLDQAVDPPVEPKSRTHKVARA